MRMFVFLLIRMAEPISRILRATDGPGNLGEQWGWRYREGWESGKVSKRS